MFHVLDKSLAKSGQGGLIQLRSRLAEMLGGHGTRTELLSVDDLARERVFRLRFEVDGRDRFVIVKSLPRERALREQRTLQRWLPRLGLDEVAAALLGVAAGAGDDREWHVYESVPGHTLEELAGDRAAMTAALDVVARVHRACVNHPLLAECRLVGPDFGPRFVETSVLDATRALVATRRLVLADRARAEMVDRLLERLHGLQAGLGERLEALQALGWPETLQHGDLWNTNVLVTRDSRGVRARLIDWDRAGVGPAAYDLSAFLRQFPASERAWVLDVYRKRVRNLGWQWPNATTLNFVFETMEFARFANCATWAALAAAQGTDGVPPEWALEDLEEVATWFRNLTPLLGAREKAA